MVRWRFGDVRHYSHYTVHLRVSAERLDRAGTVATSTRYMMACLPGALQGTNFLKFGTMACWQSETVLCTSRDTMWHPGFAPIGLRVCAPADGVADILALLRSAGSPPAANNQSAILDGTKIRQCQVLDFM